MPPASYLTASIFGMSRVVAELNDNLSLKATYVYGGQQLLKEEPSSGNRSHDVYLLSDGVVGSITHATDSSGQAKDEYRYDAFGIRSTTSQTSNSHGHYGYTGREYDEEAGLLYLRARYYDPKIGRFISADPFWGRLEEPASQNRYTYVHNNPLLYTDPLGLDADWTKFWDSIITAAGGGLQVAGGVLEMGAGGVLWTVPTGISQVAGGALIGHGAYNVTSGANTFIAGVWNADQSFQDSPSYMRTSLTEGVIVSVMGDTTNARLGGQAVDLGNDLLSGRIYRGPDGLKSMMDSITVYNAEKALLQTAPKITSSMQCVVA